MSDSHSKCKWSAGFVGLLAILFIGLKLTDVIDWSWWWVLSPLWIGAAVGIAILIVVLLVFVIGVASGRR